MLYLKILTAIHTLLIVYLSIKYNQLNSHLNCILKNQRTLTDILDIQLKIDKIGGTD